MKFPFIIFITMLFSQNTFSQKKDFTYLALGDSYTIGESVAENERFPNQLAFKLNKKGIKITKPTIIAQTGWTTDELKSGIEAENINAKTFDFVSVLIGVNNQYRGRDLEQFRKEFILQLEAAIKFAGNKPKKVFVVSIPDWGVTPFGKASTKKEISKNIDLFNAIKKFETQKKGIVFIDITPISRLAINDTSLIAEDGLHPSAKMYGLWVEKIMEEMKFE